MKTRVIVSALAAVLVTATAADAATQWYRCYRIGPGETAADIARRLTGDPVNRRAVWFQIFDARRTLVRKADYDLIQPGWRACLDEAQLRARIQAAVVGTSGPALEPPRALREPVTPLASGPPIVDPVFFWWLAWIAGAAAAASLFVAFWEMRRMRAREMRRFGRDFVREFARPWERYRGAGPVPRTRLRISPARSRLDILIAPSPGRTYPNLADHRNNVEYDVARVTAALRCNSFTNGRPHVEGEWVVLPFQFTGRLHKEGVR